MVKRRNIIMLMVAGLSGALTKWSDRTAMADSGEPEQEPLVAGLTDLFSDPAAAIEIGNVYLQDCPGSELPQCLLSGVGFGPAAPRRLEPAEFHRRRLRDFEHGNTLLLDGWIMARSELCACALLAYTHKHRRA